MKKIKGMLVRASGENRIQECDINFSSIEEIYKLLEIDTFDVIERKIGYGTYSIYCDDEALLKSPLPNRTFVTLNNGQIVEKIYGNILICKHDRNGNIKGLNRNELNELYNYSMHTYIVGHFD